MNQDQRRRYLIEELLWERSSCRRQEIPTDADRQKVLLRSLMNVRHPAAIGKRYLEVQDDYLQEELAAKTITRLSDLHPIQEAIYLWRGDITTLECGAIVNAANSGMTGCYQPCHNCIDNCIHTYAGVQLRLKCAEMMAEQGYEEPTGQAKITPAYNLPCDYVIHTVGPIVRGELTREHCALLKSCYRSCLKLADENGVGSIAFCCISTGVFMFPKVLYLELGVGNNTPVIIKYPFCRYTLENPDAVYVCINHGQAYAPREIVDRSICLNMDIGQVLAAIHRLSQ